MKSNGKKEWIKGKIDNIIYILLLNKTNGNLAIGDELWWYENKKSNNEVVLGVQQQANFTINVVASRQISRQFIMT